MFLEYSGNIISWLLEFAKRSTFVIIKSYTFNTKNNFSIKNFLKNLFLWNVPWMSQTLQHWGNTRWIFLEYCMPAGNIRYSKNYLLLLVYNNFLFLYSQNDFLHLKISSIISLIAFLSSLKTFLISLLIISSSFSIKKMFLMCNCGMNCFFF